MKLLLAVIGILIISTPTPDQFMLRENGPDPGRSSQQKTGKIRGTVTDPSGAAIPGIQVILELPDGRKLRTITDDEGRYRFDDVVTGNHVIKFFMQMSGQPLMRARNVIVRQNESANVSLVFGGPTPTPSPMPSPPPSPFPSARPSPSVAPTSRPTPRPSPSPRSSPSASPSPGASPSPTESELEAMLQNEVAKLREGKIVFNPPDQMQEQKTVVIQARISFKDIGPLLTEQLEGPGTPQVEILKVSETMRVSLTGDGDAFLIQRIGHEDQAVAGKEYAQWEWRVTPLKAGDQKLTLTAEVIIKLPGRPDAEIDHTVLNKQILVRVDRWYTIKQFMANNWQWLWAVVIVPAAGLLWGLRRKKIRRAGFR